MNANLTISKEQILELLEQLPVKERTETIIQVLADDSDGEIISAVKKALDEWGVG